MLLFYFMCLGLFAHVVSALPFNQVDTFTQEPCYKSTDENPATSGSGKTKPSVCASMLSGLMSDLDCTIFLSFMEKHHKKYKVGSKIFQKRYQIFLKSLQRHKHLNTLTTSTNGTVPAYYGVNQFSDLSAEEFSNLYLKSYSTNYTLDKPMKTSTVNNSLPLRFDWKEKKFVTQVKNQLSCGACWAFSIVGAVESAYAIKGHSLEELSVQQVIDCSYLDSGCNGGSTVSALHWLNQTQTKLLRASEYTYKVQTGLCHYFRPTEFGVSINGYEAYDFSCCEEEMMNMLINHGPLAVIVDAVSWQDYLGGIIQHHCSSGEANHAVLVTGFDRTGDIPFWIVKNSWGTTWGKDGYVYIKMGENMCGIADVVSFPLM
ncbi:cathepsin O [Bombina bombina]|uniref:cathepsin O n=1 Tax=Bombina bombina TaxID=8345 RepID=UPI00235ACC75|nr:cathepsin O [Bombina bombina]